MSLKTTWIRNLTGTVFTKGEWVPPWCTKTPVEMEVWGGVCFGLGTALQKCHPSILCNLFLIVNSAIVCLSRSLSLVCQPFDLLELNNLLILLLSVLHSTVSPPYPTWKPCQSLTSLLHHFSCKPQGFIILGKTSQIKYNSSIHLSDWWGWRLLEKNNLSDSF